MSIINDALKKTQQTFSRKPKKKEEPKVEAQPKPKKDDQVNVYEKMYADVKEKEKKANASAPSNKSAPKDVKPKKANNTVEILKAVFAFIFLVVSVTVSFKFLSNYKPLETLFGSTPFKKEISSRDKIAKHIPKARKYKAGDLVLNGISIIDGRNVALINDEIYQVGDTVNGKTVTSIGLDEVELRDDTRIYSITVR